MPRDRVDILYNAQFWILAAACTGLIRVPGLTRLIRGFIRMVSQWPWLAPDLLECRSVRSVVLELEMLSFQELY